MKWSSRWPATNLANKTTKPPSGKSTGGRLFYYTNDCKTQVTDALGDPLFKFSELTQVADLAEFSDVRDGTVLVAFAQLGRHVDIFDVYG